MPSKLFATLTRSVAVRHKIRRLNVDLGASLHPIGTISMREAVMPRRRSWGEELVIRHWQVNLCELLRRDALGAVGDARLCVA